MNCLHCSKEIKTGKYCSNTCQQGYQNKKILDEWFSGKDDGIKSGFRLRGPVREYILERDGRCCVECGWNKVNPKTGKSPLEIDHIDGNSENNRPENLRTLCPNCHSLTDTWKALNKGNANKKRLQYYGLVAQ